MRSSRCALTLLTLIALVLPATTAHGAAKRSALSLSIAGPSTLMTATDNAVKVTVRNRGRVTLRKVRVTASASLGATATLASKRPLTIKARRSKSVTLRVRAAGPGSVRLTVNARSGKHRARARKSLRADGLAGRYFWGNTYTIQGLQSFALYFVDGRWAYRGFPKGGGLPTCTQQTAVDSDDGCLPYSFDPATRALTIGGAPAQMTPEGVITYDEERYLEATIAEPGTRLAGGGTYAWQAGLCPGVTCSMGTSDMTFTADGQFGEQGYVSGGDASTGASFIVLPPDSRGTYQVTARGAITLSYADGTTKTQTIAVMRNEQGQPDAAQGVILDDTPYVAIGRN